MSIFKKFCHVAALALIGMLLSCGPGLAYSAEEFLSGCSAIANHRILMPSNPSALQCWGAFAVIQTLVNWVEPKTNEPWFGTCVPFQATRSELIVVFVKYIEAHPKRRHDDFVGVALDAIRSAYPCVPAK